MTIAPNLTAIIRNMCYEGSLTPKQVVDFGQSTGPDQTGGGLITKTYQGGAVFINPSTANVTFNPPFEAEQLTLTNGSYEFVPVIGSIVVLPGQSVTLRKKV